MAARRWSYSCAASFSAHHSLERRPDILCLLRLSPDTGCNPVAPLRRPPLPPRPVAAASPPLATGLLCCESSALLHRPVIDLARRLIALQVSIDSDEDSLCF